MLNEALTSVKPRPLCPRPAAPGANFPLTGASAMPYNMLCDRENKLAAVEMSSVGGRLKIVL
jgi:hypothetical protein